MKPLSEILIKDIIDPKRTKPKLVMIHPDTTIHDALDIMAKNNILSLPLHSRSFPNQATSVINLFDILSFIVKKCRGNCKLVNKTLDLSESVEDTLGLDVEDESYRVFSRDFRDTLAEVSFCTYDNVSPDLIASNRPFKPFRQESIVPSSPTHLTNNPSSC